MSERVYTSAVDRLIDVPEIFTGSDLTILFEWKSPIASTYLANWKKAGLIKSLGGRSDVHMNLVRNRNANYEEALKRVYPAAVKVGLDVFREAGWTTQIPAALEVVVPVTSTLHKIEGFDIATRSAKWYRTVVPGTERVANGLNRLKPAWAFIDMIDRYLKAPSSSNQFLIDPEDLDTLSVLADKEIKRALAAFERSAECLEETGYEDIYDQYTHPDAHALSDRKSSPRG